MEEKPTKEEFIIKKKDRIEQSKSKGVHFRDMNTDEKKEYLYSIARAKIPECWDENGNEKYDPAVFVYCKNDPDDPKSEKKGYCYIYQVDDPYVDMETKILNCISHDELNIQPDFAKSKLNPYEVELICYGYWKNDIEKPEYVHTNGPFPLVRTDEEKKNENDRLALNKKRQSGSKFWDKYTYRCKTLPRNPILLHKIECQCKGCKKKIDEDLSKKTKALNIEPTEK